MLTIQMSICVCVCVCSVRDTAANDESMATVLFTNLLSQLDRVRSSEMNFLQRHNMKIIQQQLQVSHLLSISRCSDFLSLQATNVNKFFSVIIDKHLISP